MPTTLERLLEVRVPDVRARFGPRDTMFYALSLGAGPDRLELVYEGALRALPTMAVVLAHPGFWARDLDTGLDWVKIVHAGQELVVHRPLPIEGEVVGRCRIVGVVDKGPQKGAIVSFERVLLDARTEEPFCTMTQTMFCRGDGGIGSTSGDRRPPRPPMPTREPDVTIDRTTLVQSALLYRLNGDMNPLHADPEVARRAGFPRPILHGLATFGVAGLAIVDGFCAGKPEHVRELGVRFTAPIYPGETLRTEVWRDDATLRFRVSAVDRGVVAIDEGFVRLQEDATLTS